MRFAFIAVLAVIVSPSVEAAQTSDEPAVISRASQRGAAMFAYDQAAWHGTDDMLAKLANPAGKVGGYIVDGPAEGPRLVFFDKMRTHAVYIANFDHGRLTGGKILGAGDDTTLSALDLRMIAAQGAAKTALLNDKTVFKCGPKPFNTIILPPATDSDPVAVYFLTPQATNEAIPFGGHYEIDVDAAGQAGPVRHFSKSCISAPVHPAVPNRGKEVAIVISTVTDPAPTEIHVFSSLALRKPLVVVAVAANGQSRAWPIVGTHIGSPKMMSPK